MADFLQSPKIALNAVSRHRSYLPPEMRGMYFYLYLFMDLFSRQIVGWQVYDCESAALANELLQAICDLRSSWHHAKSAHRLLG